MRRSSLVLLATLACASPAAAQEPVVGGATFNTAPVITPGTYQDTILPREVRIYAFEVAAGQQARVEVVPGGDPEVFEEATGLIRVRLRGPLREQSETFDAMDTTWDAGESASVAGPPAERDSDGNPFIGPGHWYVTVHAQRNAGGTPRIEFPLTVSLAVEGEGEAPAPTPTATPTATPTPTPEGPRESPVEDATPSRAASAGVGLGALAVGLLAGALLGRRRR